MLTSVTFFLLSCYSAVLCNPHGVFWTILDKHVVIGEDLNLYCNESSLAAINCCPKQSTRRWFGGPNRELLYRNGISSYPSKYTSRLEDGGFYLTIHDVEVKDLNVSYACSVSIYEYTNILLPKYDTAESSFSTEISTSTEPSISGSTTVGRRKGNTNERNDELTFMVIFIAIFLVLFIVIAIAAYHKRIKKLCKGESHLIKVVTTTENTDQNNLVERVHSNDASTTLQNDTEDINIASEHLLEDVTTTENTDQNNLVERDRALLYDSISSLFGDYDRSNWFDYGRSNRFGDGRSAISGDYCTSNWFGDGIASIGGYDGISSLSEGDGTSNWFGDSRSAISGDY